MNQPLVVTAVLCIFIVADPELRAAEFPELIDPALLGIGVPGVHASVTGSGEMDYDTGDGGMDLWDARFSTPIWKGDWGKTQLAITAGYVWTSLDASPAFGLDRQSLHNADLKFFAGRFPRDNDWMGLLMVSPGIGSDFSGLSSDDFQFIAIGVAGYQFSPELALAAGGYFRYAIGETLALPSAGLIWQPNERWLVQLTPPIVALGWSPGKNWTFSLATYPAGGGWDLDGEGRDQRVEAVSLTLWRAGVGIERRIGEHLRFTAMAGMNFGGELEVRDDGERVLFGRDLDPAPYALLGVKWAF